MASKSQGSGRISKLTVYVKRSKVDISIDSYSRRTLIHVKLNT